MYVDYFKALFIIYKNKRHQSDAFYNSFIKIKN